MTDEQWFQVGGMGFALAVMSWVIYRLTWTIVKLVKQDPDAEQVDERSAD